jgi:NAD(P)H-hydrate epimerase
MQPILTSEESRALDKHLIDELGLSPLVLMENAARGALHALEDWLQESGTVLIFCGKGNNGGDGLALARMLHERNVDVVVLIAGSAKELSPDALQQYTILKKLLPKEHIHHYPIRDSHFISHIDIKIVVDALLGTGVNGPVKGKSLDALLDLFGIATHFNAKVLALDVPTGLNATTGECETTVTEEGVTYTVCVTAHRTVTMGTAKVGLYLGQGPERTGDITVAPLGSKGSLVAKKSTYLLERTDIKSLFARRKRSTSKFDYGHVLSISGSRGMTGAAIMAATGALRVGAGLVSVATPASERHIVASAMPELMTVGLWHDEEGLPLATSLNEIQHHLAKATVVHYGSGITLTNDTHEVARRVLREIDKPLVLDAGALLGLRNDHALFRKRTAPTIITPHSGEMASLVGIDREHVEVDRIGTARTFAQKNKTIVVLKGAPTVVAMPSGNVYINSTGNAGMATAGVGDVLAGMIAGLVAQHEEDSEKAVLGAVYLHGLSGDLACEELGEVFMSAMDLVAHIPPAIVQITG